MNQYWGFGLNIYSEIEFPELLPAVCDSANLTIVLGTTPKELLGADVITTSNFSISATEYLLHVQNVGKYYASNGNKIIVEPTPGIDNSSVRLYLLGNAMAAILHQQNKIPFHASGIITNNELVLFSGPSGMGKSTTLYALLQKGYKLFTDDVCVLLSNEETGNIEAVASYPMMKLWENTLDQFNKSDSLKEHRLRPHVAKYGVFNHSEFSTKNFKISRIFLIDIDNDARTDFSVRKLPGVEAFYSLQQNTYRRDHVDMMQLYEHHFNIITRLTNQAEIFSVKRRSDGSIISFIDQLEKFITTFS